MSPWPARLPLRRLAACAALLAGLPAGAAAWSGYQHYQINKAAGRAVPQEMDAFRSFSRPMAFPGIYPDLWKEADPEETPRHYFEPDRLPPGTDIRALSPVQAEAFAQIESPPDEIGIAPWTILDLLERMTAAMRTNDWLLAARCGATLGHYVADLHMPLHCTRNYNGQDTRQDGIHERVESEMARAFLREYRLAPATAVYLEHPFREIMGWIEQSAALVPDILRADLIAKNSANRRTDTENYYRKLWELTGDTVRRQIDDAATHLSSLWYTAWVDAGKPPIPDPFEELPTLSLHSGVGIDPPTEGGPVGARQRPRHQNRFDVIIWTVMGVIALLTIASSVVRGVRERRAGRK